MKTQGILAAHWNPRGIHLVWYSNQP